MSEGRTRVPFQFGRFGLKNGRKVKAVLTQWVMAGCLGAMIATPAMARLSAGVSDEVQTNVPTQRQRDLIEQELVGRIQAIVAAQERMEGQGIIPHPIVRYADDGRSIIVDLGAGYVPKVNGGEFEDHLMEIMNEVISRAENVAPVSGVEFLFGGRDIYDYFPEDRRPDPRQNPPRASATGAPIPVTKVMVSAGHGLYIHRTRHSCRLRIQ